MRLSSFISIYIYYCWYSRGRQGRYVKRIRRVGRRFFTVQITPKSRGIILEMIITWSLTKQEENWLHMENIEPWVLYPQLWWFMKLVRATWYVFYIRNKNMVLSWYIYIGMHQWSSDLRENSPSNLSDIINHLMSVSLSFLSFWCFVEKSWR